MMLDEANDKIEVRQKHSASLKALGTQIRKVLKSQV